MRYWLADGRTMIRSRSEAPGSWEVYDWLTQHWEPAPGLEPRFTRHWRQIGPDQALQLAAGALDERVRER